MADINAYFKSVVHMDRAPVVLCDTEGTILYMNPAAVKRYASYGGEALVGRNISLCHNEHANLMLQRVLDWFLLSPDNNLVYTMVNEKENKDVYMAALRDDQGKLIGYYEKHEYRDHETMAMYEGVTLG